MSISALGSVEIVTNTICFWQHNLGVSNIEMQPEIFILSAKSSQLIFLSVEKYFRVRKFQSMKDKKGDVIDTNAIYENNSKIITQEDAACRLAIHAIWTSRLSWFLSSALSKLCGWPKMGLDICGFKTRH